MKIDIEKLKAEIGEKLREAREEANMSQEELASMLGLSKVGYGALERGKNLIGLQYLIMLTFILKKPITYFLPPFCVTPEEMNNLNLDPTFRRWAECYLAMPDEIRRGLVGTLERVAGLPPTRPFEPAPPAEE